MPGPDKLPTEAEQWATYNARKVEFERKYQAWKDGGCQGPLPPRPIPPHVPGWRIERDDFRV